MATFRAPAAALAIALLAGLPALALAQDESPVLVEAVGPLALAGADGETVEVVWRLTNLNTRQAFSVSASAVLPTGWTAEFVPKRLTVDPSGEASVAGRFVPDPRAPAKSEIPVTFSVMNTETGAVARVAQVVEVAVAREALVFEAFRNPLPSPLDNAYGVFIVEFAAWVGIATVSILGSDSLVRFLTRRATVPVAREIIGKVRVPFFAFVLLLGFRDAFGVLPDNPVTLFIERTLAVLAIGFAGAHLVYRIVDSMLFYYTMELAPRTSTQVDDVLIPALRKISLVAVVVFNIGYALKHLFGVDPSVLFGAAGIMGLVIAFAAQDTLSNFFSGVFLLLDQPFREGDDIQLEGGEVCRVEKIGLRSTHLLHYKNYELIVLPNNQLASRRVVNLVRPDKRFRIQIEVGVAYGSDIDRVKRVLDACARAHPNVLKDGDHAPFVMFTKFGESSLDFLMLCFVDDLRERGRAASEIRQAIHDAFQREGIDIPFPQRTLWIKTPAEGLPPAGARALVPERKEGA